MGWILLLIEKPNTMTKFYLLLIASALFASCKTATKSYNKGDYTNAIELGVKKLQKDPGDIETKELVKRNLAFRRKRFRFRYQHSCYWKIPSNRCTCNKRQIKKDRRVSLHFDFKMLLPFFTTDVQYSTVRPVNKPSNNFLLVTFGVDFAFNRKTEYHD